LWATIAMKSLLSGKKFNRRHTTFVPGAKDFLHQLKALDCVKKITLGPITPTKTGVISAKIRRIDGHLIEILFRDSTAVQLFILVSSNKYPVKALLEPYQKKPSSKTKPKYKPVDKLPKKNKKMDKQRRLAYQRSNDFSNPTLGDIFKRVIDNDR